MSLLTALPLDEFETQLYDITKMRLGLGLSLFMPRPFADTREGVLKIWRLYLDAVGAKTLTWARLGGGNRSRKVSASVLKTVDGWLSGQQDYGKECDISIHDGLIDELGTTGFYLEGLGPGRPTANDVSFLEVYLPLAMLDSPGPAAVADLFTQMVVKVPFLCGTAGFVFHQPPYSYGPLTKRMAELSKRFRGVQVMKNIRMRYWAGRGVTSVNWITFVADSYLDKIGERKTVRRNLQGTCTLTDLQHGLAIQAGGTPLLGDANKGKDGLDAWRKVYKVLKPVMFEDTAASFGLEVFDAQQTQEWLTRLDSP